MIHADRLSEFLQKLTPLSRNCLLSELERLELCGIDIPGSSDTGQAAGRIPQGWIDTEPGRQPFPPLLHAARIFSNK